ncbi:hypothetical protein NS319_14265 [Sphingomonas sanguinis]|uniref:Uncharacterized protein n=2 Tax=Sphingomonas sanguinis TaxID=33051 RepID=A0A147HU23_9SPHN|nr:hypothetical protein NS319_14265 [Sphingomonas sanguinis]
MGRMMVQALFALWLAAAPLPAASDAEVDPATINVVDAIDCRLNTDSYGALTMALDEEAKRRGWRPVEGKNPFLQEYELPQPIRVGEGWTTRRIAFSANALLAILDIADPKTVADRIGITNTMPDLSGQGVAAKFLGQHVVSDETVLPKGEEKFGTHSIIARSVSTVTSHPGKTLYGCSYATDVIGRDGKPI